MILCPRGSVRQGDIPNRAQPGACARFILRPGAGIKGVSVNRQKAHSARVVEDLLRTVPVMNIEVYDQNAIELVSSHCVRRGHCDIAVDAKPHTLRRPGMMSRWPPQTESPAACLVENVRHSRDRGTGG